MNATATLAPHSLEAEISVLGQCLQDAEAARVAAERLRVSDFFQDRHAEIFGAIQSLVTQGEPVNPLSIYRELVKRGKAQEVGSAYLVELVDRVPTAANIAQHCRFLREDAAKRQLGDLCTKAAAKVKTEGADLAGLVADVRRQLDAITPVEAGRPFLVRAADLKAEPVSFTVHGLLPTGMLALLSGRDKRGKTLFAQEIVRAVLRGEALFGRFPTQRGPVVAAFLDDPPSLTLDRLTALGIRDHPDLYLVDPLAFEGDAMRFLDQLEAEATKVCPALLVIDSFYQLVPPGRDSGNDQARMAPLMARLNRLAGGTGPAVEVVAHDNKSGMDVAGSHVIRAAAKCIKRLTLPRGAETEDPDEAPATPRRILTVESKFAAATSWALEIRDVGDWRCYGSPQDLRASDTLSAIQVFLAGGGSGTTEEIAEKVKRRREDVERAVTVLLEKGEAVSGTRKPKGKGRPATVYKGREFPSEFPSGELDGTENPQQEALEFPRFGGTGEFPSRVSPPRGRDRGGNSSEALKEVEL